MAIYQFSQRNLLISSSQAPKINAQPAKLSQILTWFHKSGVAHSIKDLEKALPSVASINGMHVKDYLQALSDENQIKVEKIGSGNWYWAFAGEERVAAEKVLEKVTEEKEKVAGVVEELRDMLEEAAGARIEDQDGDRQGMLDKKEGLEKEVELLRRELEGHSENDPVEVDRRKEEVETLKGRTEIWTEHCFEMERWLREKMGMERERLTEMKRDVYKDQFDEEEEGLKEL